MEGLAGGQKVVFTNGCYDLIHPGHIHCLKQAARLGDYLVVGINSDASVKRLKGEGRPLISQEERALMLAALAVVDAVVIFEEDTPTALISELRPDVHVKGADYADKGIPERAVVESYGGSVELVELKPGWSTTDFIERLRRLSTRN